MAVNNPFTSSRFVSHKGAPHIKPTPADMSDFLKGTVGNWVSIPGPYPKNVDYLQKEREKRSNDK